MQIEMITNDASYNWEVKAKSVQDGIEKFFHVYRFVNQFTSVTVGGKEIVKNGQLLIQRIEK